MIRGSIHMYKNQYIVLIPQKLPLLNMSVGLKLNPVKIKAAHTNRNGMAAIVITINILFITVNSPIVLTDGRQL